MEFDAILDQAIALLQQRGRLTYGALKRQFQLDDEYLADLKAELIDGQRVAVDEDGKVLVWTGSPESKFRTSPKSRLRTPNPEPRTLPRELHASASGRAHPCRQRAEAPERRTQDHHRPVCRSQRLDGVD